VTGFVGFNLSWLQVDTYYCFFQVEVSRNGERTCCTAVGSIVFQFPHDCAGMKGCVCVTIIMKHVGNVYVTFFPSSSSSSYGDMLVLSSSIQNVISKLFIQ
jgi:hypothetical protein